MTVAPPSVLALAEALIACPSVTPAAGLVFDCLEGQLRPLGFEVHRFSAGEASSRCMPGRPIPARASVSASVMPP